MWLGVGSLLALLAASMLIAIVVVVSLKADERHLNDRDVHYASAVAVAALNAKGIANDQRGYLLTDDTTSSTKPTAASVTPAPPSPPPPGRPATLPSAMR
jgi:pyridoxine 5'-phosphate synthase PdxJ